MKQITGYNVCDNRDIMTIYELMHTVQRYTFIIIVIVLVHINKNC